MHASADWCPNLERLDCCVYAYPRPMGGRAARSMCAVIVRLGKLFSTESAQQVIDSALQLFGGLGVINETPVEQLYREVRALRIYEGRSESLRMAIGSKVLEDIASVGDKG